MKVNNMNFEMNGIRIEEGKTREGLSEFELRRFRALDELAEVGEEFLQNLYKRFIPRDFDRDSFDFEDFDFDVFLDKFQGKARGMIQNLRDDYKKFREMEMNREVALILFNDQLMKALHRDDFIGEVNFSLVPGGLMVTLDDTRGLMEPGVAAAYLENVMTAGGDEFWKDRFILINRTDDDYIENARHEYWHLLNHLYIEPNEIEIPKSKVLQVLEVKKQEINEMIEELKEELEFCDEDEVEGILQELQRFKKEKKKIKEIVLEEKKKIPFFVSDEARELFNNFRDELSAYSVCGRFCLIEDRLIPRGFKFKGFEERLSELPEEDEEKFRGQWHELKNYLSNLKGRVSPDDYTGIFMTSQNFVEMKKRIQIKFEDYEMESVNNFVQRIEEATGKSIYDIEVGDENDMYGTILAKRGSIYLMAVDEFPNEDENGVEMYTNFRLVDLSSDREVEEGEDA